MEYLKIPYNINYDSYKTIDRDEKDKKETRSDNKSIPTKSSVSENQISSIEDIEAFQIKIIDQFYDMYKSLSLSVGKIDPSIIKKSFDNYIYQVEQKYTKNISQIYCDEEDLKKGYKETFKKPLEDEKLVCDQIKTLGYEYYALFKVMDKLWKNYHIELTDVLYLIPCRVFILDSLVKRKFGEHIRYRCSN